MKKEGMLRSHMYNEKTFRRSMAAEFYSFAEPGWWGWWLGY